MNPAYVDYALEQWARWGKSGLSGLGWPNISILGRVIEQGFTGAAQHGTCLLEVNETCELIERAVLRLRKKEREVLIKHYVYWQPVEVSARCLHMTPNHFRVVLSRARRSVADYLEGVSSITNTIQCQMTA